MPAKKLTADKVKEIRRRYEARKAGAPKVMAREFGVSIPCIRRVIFGEAWKWVE